MLPRQRPQVSDDAPVETELQTGLHAVFDRRETLVLELDTGLGQRAGRQARERRGLAPHVERVPERLPRGSPIGCRRCRTTPGRKAAVALQIELVGVDLEGVARVARHDRPPAPVDALDRRAKPRDVDRNGMGRRRRRTLPHSVDERVRRHRPAVAEHQGGQNRTRLLAAQPDRPGVTDDLDRSEHPKIHRNPLPPSPAVAVCIECGKATTWPVEPTLNGC